MTNLVAGVAHLGLVELRLRSVSMADAGHVMRPSLFYVWSSPTMHFS